MKLIQPNQKIVVFGSRGMVGSAVCVESLKRHSYTNLITPNKNQLNLLDFLAVEKWFNKFKPEIVVLCAAKVGGILANSKYPADFILENLKIQTNVIEASWRYGVKNFFS